MPRSVKKSHEHCCDLMALKVDRACSLHSDLLHCPQTQIYYDARVREYGLPYHDCSDEFSQIHFCFWCGAKVPDSLRPEFEKRLRELGVSGPLPEEFQSDAWYKKKSKKTSSSGESGLKVLSRGCEVLNVRGIRKKG